MKGHYSERRGEVGSAHVVVQWVLHQLRLLVGIDQLGSSQRGGVLPTSHSSSLRLTDASCACFE